jgi:glutathione S-transferase
LAPHIALREAAVEHEIVWFERGQKFSDVNAKNKVPVLEYDDGTRLAENIAVLLDIADAHPNVGLAPRPNSQLRVRLYEWLSFVATELHKQVLAPSFDRAAPEAAKTYVLQLLPGLLGYVDQSLVRREFLVGDRFSVADAYLFWATILIRKLGVELARFTQLERFRVSVAARPAVTAALGVETEALRSSR